MPELLDICQWERHTRNGTSLNENCVAGSKAGKAEPSKPPDIKHEATGQGLSWKPELAIWVIYSLGDSRPLLPVVRNHRWAATPICYLCELWGSKLGFPLSVWQGLYKLNHLPIPEILNHDLYSKPTYWLVTTLQMHNPLVEVMLWRHRGWQCSRVQKNADVDAQGQRTWDTTAWQMRSKGMGFQAWCHPTRHSVLWDTKKVIIVWLSLQSKLRSNSNPLPFSHSRLMVSESEKIECI